MLSIDLELKRKYIDPLQDNHSHYIGVEFEIPIVNLKRLPVDDVIIHKMTESFANRFDYTVLHRDDDGYAYSLQNKDTGDNLSFDFCYSNLELSMGKETDLNVLYNRFLEYYKYIQKFLEPYEYTLTGMGINPYYRINRNFPINSGRYQMLYSFLNSYTKYQEIKTFHNYPNYGAFTSASQVQLDVNQNNLIEVINTFDQLEPFKMLLFANSYTDEYPNLLCIRDTFWINSMHGFNPHNVGIHEHRLDSIQDLIDYIKSSSIYYVKRDENYLFFEPTPLEEYVKLKKIIGYSYRNGRTETVTCIPEIEDLQYLRTFNFQDLTYRGTIEFRSVCCQPICDIMSVAAFHVGLMENLSELSKALYDDNIIYRNGTSPIELRKLFNFVKLPSFIDKNELSSLLLNILDICRSGLIRRNKGEQKFLEPLYTRAMTLSNPARRLHGGLIKGKSLEDYILEYSRV